MGQRLDFIKVAEGELGVIEGPKENETKYGAFTKANFLPWCGSFVNWCANQVGLKIPNCVSTVAGATAFMKKKQFLYLATLCSLIFQTMELTVSHILGLWSKIMQMEQSPVSRATLPQIRRVTSATEGKSA